MPHVCIRCKTRLVASEGLAPRCPECGGTKFSYESDRRRTGNQPGEPGDQVRDDPVSQAKRETEPETKKATQKPAEPIDPDSIESIRILEPGKYDLNLLKLAESDDRVIGVGKDGNYRLDLYSMMRPKKKR